MSLTRLELDLLVSIDRLTRDDHRPADTEHVEAELDRMGVGLPTEMWLYE